MRLGSLVFDVYSGHSMGGKTAMVLALEQPQLVDKLVVADVSPTVVPTAGEMDLVRTMRSLDLSSVRNRREADAIMQSSIPVCTNLTPGASPEMIAV